MKLITFAVPCYNSAEYMHKCIDSLLIAGDNAEILIIDDGSFKDDTAKIADEYEKKHPGICRAIHKENGGHGDAVYTGIHNASGLFFKVVDSDDWLDVESLLKMIDVIRTQNEKKDLPDLIITNYVYERVYDNKRHTNSFKHILPEGRIFGWDDTKSFNYTHYLTMHTLTYRTQVLLDSGITFPKHTFYVDNIYAYVPMTLVNKLYYINCDMYRYFIGRSDQSVNEKVMISRLDQQLRVNRLLIDSQKTIEAGHPKQKKCIIHYLTVMMMVSSTFCNLAGEDGVDKKEDIWEYLEYNDPETYQLIIKNPVNKALKSKSKFINKFSIFVYRIVQKIMKFN